MGSHRRRLLRCERLEPRMLLDGSQILTPLVSSGALASTLVPDLAFEDAAGASWTSESFIENAHGETWISGPTRKTGVGYDQGLPELDPTHVYAWYDAAHSDSVNGVGADADQDPISLLADLSGNGRDLIQTGTSDQQPSYQTNRLDGQAVIHFDGNDSLTGDPASPFGTLPQPNTVMVVVKVDASNGGYVYDSVQADGRNAVLTRNAGITAWHLFAGGLVIGEPADLVLDQWQVHTYVFDGIQSGHYVNGQLQASGNAGSQDLRGLTLGARYSLNFHLTGDVAEFVVFDETLSHAARQDAEDYLTQKWLPNGAPTTYDPLIETDVEADAFEINASTYVRIPLSVNDPDVDQLTLRIQYDDGFVAYLNGTEIARRNAPGVVGTPLPFNAAATAFQPKLQATVFEEIDVTAHISLLNEGPHNILAIQGLNIDAADQDLLILPELIGGTFAVPQLPTIATLPPHNTGANFADAAGEILDTGNQDPTILVYYGTADGAAVAADWDAYLELGPRGAGRFTAHLPALDPDTTYFYRLLASNSAGNQWATGSQSFTTHAMPDVAINEFLASNQNGTYVDQDNRDSDWIEIYNPGPAEVDLFGWSLTDQADQLTKWSFPTQTLEEGEFLMVFASGNDRALAGEELHTNFQLNSDGEYLGLVKIDGATIASHFGSATENFPPQRSDVSFGPTVTAAPEEIGDFYMAEPTPGAANAVGQLGLVPDTIFSVDRGFYHATDLQPGGRLENGVSLATRSHAPPGTTLLYTTDGSVPDLANPGTRTYTSPIPVTTTTTLRAVAVADRYLPSNVDTQTYLFTADVLHQDGVGLPPLNGSDYEFDPNIVNDPRYSSLAEDLQSLPTVSFVLPVEDIFGPTGIIDNAVQTGSAWEREASVELIYPDGREGFQENAGLRIQGAGSRARSFSKKSFQLFFRGEYGASALEFPFFGPARADQFDRIVFRGNFFDSWTVNGTGTQGGSCCGFTQALLLRDQFGHATHEAMGALAIAGNWVHLYLNGQYWGLYNATESPDEHFAESYLGENAESYDVLKQRLRGLPNGSPPEVVQGDLTAWNALMTLVRQDTSSAAVYQQIQQLIDVEQFADYVLLNMWGGNFDWPHNNWYALRERNAADSRWTFVAWDTEHFIFNVNSDRTEFNTDNSPGIIFSKLRLNDEFRLFFADRVQRHLFQNGALSSPRNIERFQAMVDEIESAMNAESARWGDTHVEPPRNTIDTWLPEVDHKLETYFPQRGEIVLDQFRADNLYPNFEAPEFLVDGEPQPGGSVATTALIEISQVELGFVDTILVAAGTPVNAYVPLADEFATTVWTETTFDPQLDPIWNANGVLGTTGVGYDTGDGTYLTSIQTEVTGVQNTSRSALTRIEFLHDDHKAFDRLRLELRYDDAFVAYLNGVEVARSNNVGLTSPPQAATASGHEATSSFESFDISEYEYLLIDQDLGSNVLAVQIINSSLGSSDLLMLPKLTGGRLDVTGTGDPIWFTTDGTDPRDPSTGLPSASATHYTVGTSLTENTTFKARAFQGADWSALSQATFTIAELADFLVISEINYHPHDPTPGEDPQDVFEDDDFEFLELYNSHESQTLDLTGVRITEGPSTGFHFAGSHVTSLGPRAHVLIVNHQLAFEARYGTGLSDQIAGQYTGKLDNLGEQIVVLDRDGVKIQHVTYGDTSPWPAKADGDGYSLVLVNPNSHPDHTQASSWRASNTTGGSPGADDGVILLLGDYDRNRIVDAADFTVWRDTWGQIVPHGSGADGSRNGIIDQDDATVWRQNFGTVLNQTASAAEVLFELTVHAYSDPTTGQLRPPKSSSPRFPLADVNGDGYVSPVDALQAIQRNHWRSPRSWDSSDQRRPAVIARLAHARNGTPSSTRDLDRDRRDRDGRDRELHDLVLSDW